MKNKFEDDSDCIRCGAYGPNDENTPCIEVPGTFDTPTGEWEPMVSLPMSEHRDMVDSLNTVKFIAEELDRQIQCIRDSRPPVKGMHVPYHGPFASAVPSVLKDLERLSIALKAAIRTDDK